MIHKSVLTWSFVTDPLLICGETKTLKQIRYNSLIFEMILFYITPVDNHKIVLKFIMLRNLHGFA